MDQTMLIERLDELVRVLREIRDVLEKRYSTWDKVGDLFDGRNDGL